MASETRGRARGGKQRGSTIRIATPRGGFRAWRETIAAEGITFPILVGLLHLLIVQTVASLAFRFGSLNSSSPPYKDVLGDPLAMTGWERVLVEPLRLWDGLWYALIAREGYGPITLQNGTTYALDARAAFWPLFPWLMRLGHDLTGLAVDTVGWIIANIAFFIALPLLYRLIIIDFDLPTARRTIIALAFFPTVFFFSAVYTESLFLLLTVGALLAARQDNWFLAGCIGLLAALTRSQGVLLLIPFAVLFIQHYGWRPLRWIPNALFAVLPALGPVLFGWHLERAQESETGQDWLAFVTAQEQWDRFSATPWETLDCAINGCIVPAAAWDGPSDYPVQGMDWSWISQFARDPGWDLLVDRGFRARVGNGDWLELVCFVGFVGLAIIGLRLLPLYASAYVWPQLLIPLFGPSIVSPLMSMPRFVLALWPLFIVLALLVQRRRVAIPVLVISCIMLVLLTMQFAQWYWVS